MNLHFKICLAALVATALTGCRVETKSESIPEAEGSGKKALNVRVEPMSRDEVKQAASVAIDKTADAAQRLGEVATTAAGRAKNMAKDAGTLTSGLIEINRQTATNDGATSPAE